MKKKKKRLYFHTFEVFFGNLAIELTELLSVWFYIQKKAGLTFERAIIS